MTDELPERRQGYRALKKQLDEYIEEERRKSKRFFIKALGAFAFIGAMCALALVGFGYTLHQVQQQRFEATFNNCLAQNDRHDAAIRKADQLPLLTPSNIQQIIDELQPYQPDCRAYANSRVKGLK